MGREREREREEGEMSASELTLVDWNSEIGT